VSLRPEGEEDPALLGKVTLAGTKTKPDQGELVEDLTSSPKIKIGAGRGAGGHPELHLLAQEPMGPFRRSVSRLLTSIWRTKIQSVRYRANLETQKSGTAILARFERLSSY
jgi:hypothetical protein